MSNYTKFFETLKSQFEILFETDKVHYDRAKAKYNAEELAGKMTQELANGNGGTEGAGVRNTCKILGIKPTQKAIREYLKS